MIQLNRKSRKRAVIIIIGSILVLLIVVTIIAIRKADQKPAQTIIQDTGYSTVLPSNKSIAQLGGWLRVSPAESSPVYAYNDTIDGVAISVSEQPIPTSFEGSVDSHVAELAKSYDATSTVKSGDTTVYIGSSAKGPQSVIFTKNNLLILIKSEKPIKNTAWSSYAASLQ